MEKPKGYFYDNNTLRQKVKGFKDLSPFARHAVKDILDLIWENESLSINDDETLQKYLGFNNKQWKDIKIELTSLNQKFLSKKDKHFYSPWLSSQALKTPDILKEFSEYEDSYSELEDIEDISDMHDVEPDSQTSHSDDSYIEDDVFSQGKRNVLFREKNNSLGASTRASIVSNKILKRYIK
jgi:hypothetical protein